MIIHVCVWQNGYVGIREYRNRSMIYMYSVAGERNRGYALLMKANKPETALYRAPTPFFLCHMVELVHVRH